MPLTTAARVRRARAGSPAARRDFSWYLPRGLAAGAVAGVVSALYLLIVQQPLIRRALDIEEARGATGAGAHDHDEVFSRGTQVVGGMVGQLLYGLVIALVFTVVFVSIRHRLSGRTDFDRSVHLAAIGFVTLALIPGLKYPASPPGVGDPDTVNSRALAYAALLAAGVLLAIVAAQADRWLRDRSVPEPARRVGVAGGFVAAVVLVLLVWPAAPAVPADMPAGLIWEFRIASLAGLALVWAVIGAAFGLLTAAGDRSAPAEPVSAKVTGAVH